MDVGFIPTTIPTGIPAPDREPVDTIAVLIKFVACTSFQFAVALEMLQIIQVESFCSQPQCHCIIANQDQTLSLAPTVWGQPSL
jgi:hypothetical protein